MGRFSTLLAGAAIGADLMYLIRLRPPARRARRRLQQQGRLARLAGHSAADTVDQLESPDDLPESRGASPARAP